MVSYEFQDHTALPYPGDFRYAPQPWTSRRSRQPPPADDPAGPRAVPARSAPPSPRSPNNLEPPPEGPGTPQADLYSLGKVLYEISTGLDRRRFSELPEDLPSWPERQQVIEFNEIVLKACAKDTSRRYQTAEQLRADLTLLQEGKSVPRMHGTLLPLASENISFMIGLIAAAIVAGVLLIARPSPRSRLVTQPLSTNAEAVACYKQAVYLLQSSTPESLWLAYTNLSRAVALDAGFIQAYSAFLDLY